MPSHPQYLEFVFGGVSTCGAALFTNPLEVVKTRMQLQGELLARGQFTVHYRNVFHAFFTIAKHEGVGALQKGLGPALAYQFVMNGFRLGTFQVLNESLKESNGHISVMSSIAAGAAAGALGGFFGSPLYMVKTQMQSRSTAAIAVGHQHDISRGMPTALAGIYRQYGVKGLWRGVSGAVCRVTVGSIAQLTTFAQTKQYIMSTGMFPAHSLLNPFLASTLSGCVIVAFMTPFDVVSTRLYNQKTRGATSKGGLLYSSVFDCFAKIFKSEGLWGFYKGWAASLFRLGPHTVLSLVFWDQTRSMYSRWNESRHVTTSTDLSDPSS